MSFLWFWFGGDEALYCYSTCPSVTLLYCRKSKTKPNGKKPPAEEKKQYLEPEFTKIRVVDFDLKELVVLPREIDLNEWLASNSEWRRWICVAENDDHCLSSKRRMHCFRLAVFPVVTSTVCQALRIVCPSRSALLCKRRDVALKAKSLTRSRPGTSSELAPSIATHGASLNTVVCLL